MKRENAIDELRGLFLVVMALNHDGGPLSRLTHESFGFVSAAEGFIFLSGLAIGWAHAVPASPSASSFSQRAFQKARCIYLYHLVSILFVMILVRLFPLEAAESRWSDRLLIVYEQPLSAILLGITLLYRPKFFDILPMYILLILAVPFLIRRYQAGKSTALLLVSSSLWAFSQTGMNEDFNAQFLRVAETDLGYFDFFAWQFLFILGTWLGFNGRTPSAARLLNGAALLPVVLTLTLLLFLTRHQPAPFDSVFPFSLQDATEKSHLGWLRLMNVLLIAYLIARLLQTCPHLFRCRWLAFLGEHSLPVFTYHVLVLYLLEFFVREPIAQYRAGPVILSALFILSLAFPASVHRYYKQRTTRRQPALTYRVEGNKAEVKECRDYIGTK